MIKQIFVKMGIISCMFSLLLLAACSSNSGTVATHASSSPQAQVTPTAIVPSISPQAQAAATPTASQTDFAARVGSSGNPVNRDAHGDNLTTIHSAVDRPIAKFTQTTLPVPPRAKGNVYIQNNSANPQTLVSDTANGFATFTIAPYTSTTLVFYRTGTFQAHLKDYPMSADTTMTIVITYPSVG